MIRIRTPVRLIDFNFFFNLFVLGVRESYVNLCSNVDDKLKIYRENFERAYILATESFYKIQARRILSLRTSFY
jgi:cullin-5